MSISPEYEVAVRQYFDAYRTGHRPDIEAVLHADFRFTSPQDDRIDTPAYMAKCFSGANQVRGHEIELIEALGEGEAFVKYLMTFESGAQMRNLEHFYFRDGRIAAVEVYFGRTAPADADTQR